MGRRIQLRLLATGNDRQPITCSRRAIDRDGNKEDLPFDVRCRHRDQRSRLLGRLFARALGLRFGQIHFVDFSMKRSAADAELFSRSGYVAVRCGKRLGNQPSFRFVQIERAGFFTERLGW